MEALSICVEPSLHAASLLTSGVHFVGARARTPIRRRDAGGRAHSGSASVAMSVSQIGASVLLGAGLDKGNDRSGRVRVFITSSKSFGRNTLSKFSLISDLHP